MAGQIEGRSNSNSTRREKTMELKAVHICFEVEDFEKAMTFWGPLFAAGDFAKGWSDDKSYAGYTNKTMTLFISESKPRRVRREAPTGKEFVVSDHVGFSLARREDVDAMAAAMRAAGIEPLFPAQEYPEFGPGFYAVTFCDSDNNVIEFAHRAG
jgi:predicted lactoylglutathione lyase